MRILYLHVLFFNDLKFYPSLVRSINNINDLKPEQHFFITCNENVFKSIAQYSNVRLVKRMDLYKYIYISKYVIFHSMPLKKWQFILLPRFICKRIIWRTWGHDVRPFERTGLKIYDFLKYVEFQIYKKKLRTICAIGVANKVDIINVEETYNYKFKYFKLNYLNSIETIDLLKKITISKDHEYLKIMIGHNCSPVDNHLEILDILSKYKNEKIHLLIPLSYSNPENGYKEKVIKKAYDIFGQANVTILEDFITLDAYLNIIASIDIAIMDMYYSNGLSNISYVLYFGKKLYIKKNSNFDKAFLRENIVPNYTSEIVTENFNEFKTNNFDIKYNKFCDDLLDKNVFKNGWLKLINELGEKNDK